MQVNNNTSRRRREWARLDAYRKARRNYGWNGTTRRQAKGKKLPHLAGVSLERQVPAQEKTWIEAMRVKY